MSRTRCCALVAVALLPLSLAAPAAAQQRDVQVSVSPASAAPGDEVRATVAGCEAGQRAQVALNVAPGGVIEQGRANGEGAFAGTLRVPANAEPGQAAVVGQCQTEAMGTDGRDEAMLTIVAARPGQGPDQAGGATELPLTGPRDVLPEATVGVTLTVLGALLVVAGRRRAVASDA